MRTDGPFPTSALGAALLALPVLLVAGCAEAPDAAGPADPELAPRMGIGTTPGFSDWIVEPTVFNDAPVTFTPDVDTCPSCPDGTALCAIEMNPTTERLAELLVPLPDSPTQDAQCNDGGGLDFGFRNQGQCVRYVQTGKDSRTNESV